MVKKSTKSKSKRITLRKKHKIVRKVKEHHRKKAKEARKEGVKHRNRVVKDPGIPNEWPFREQELKALEERRVLAIEELELKKTARKERAKKRKLGSLEDADISILVDRASSKDKKFEEQNIDAHLTSIEKCMDNSDWAFYKELVKVVEASDVILEVLDSRDPLGTRCVGMEKMVMNAGYDKQLVLLLNKIDLVPRECVEKWLKYLRAELPAVAFKCSTQAQRSRLGWKSSKHLKQSGAVQSNDCLGAETLVKLLKNYSRSHEVKKSIMVGVVGLPNVGKSSVINSLKRCCAVNVGAAPGLTRSMQEVKLDQNIRLLDCPGIVMLKNGEANSSLVVLTNCKRIEKLDDPFGPVGEILKLCPARLLVSIYKIPEFDAMAADDFLQKLATVRGRLKKGGLLDIDAAARTVLHDWTEGKIPYCTMPPARSEDEFSEVKIVAELGKEFSIEEAYAGENSFIGSLKSLNDFGLVEVSPCPFTFDEGMIEWPCSPDGGAEDVAAVEEEGYEFRAGGEAKSTNYSKAEAARQNEKLYSAEGMLNPKVRRAENKRKKVAKGDTMDEDYDFRVDFVGKKDVPSTCKVMATVSVRKGNKMMN